MDKKRTLHVGILAHEFLVNIGANDFLKNLIRGLALERDVKITFLTPQSNEKVEMLTPSTLKEHLKKFPLVKELARSVMRYARPITDRLISEIPGEYDFYVEACTRMTVLASSIDAETLRSLRTSSGIDVFLPSIHILPRDLPYVTYWPDCQPKYYPEFFDDEAQRVRDERIHGLLNSGKPMIINSRDAKADIVKFYGADPDQIFDLPLAPIIESDKLIPRPELAKNYELPRRYFLVCNQFWVHKSIETVIEAAALSRAKGLDVDFVFTGRMQEPRKPGYIDSLRQLVVDRGVSDTVRFLDYIPKDDQLELMKGCVAVIQPTLFEGGPGGGSVYDAMSLGVRSIVSDIPINFELPLRDGYIETFEKRNPQSLLEKVTKFLHAPYRRPPSEDLFLQSKTSTSRLSERLYEAIDYSLAQ